MRAIAGVVSCFLVAVSAIFAQTSPALNDGGKAGGTGVVAQCEEDIRQKVVAVQADYAAGLESLIKYYQPRGELENIIAVKQEQDRFKNAGRISPDDIVTAPEELRSLQTKYEGLMGQAEKQVVEGHLTSLEETKKRLTIEGKFDEALAVKDEIEQMHWRYDMADLADDSIAKALVGQWHGKLATGWEATYLYWADGSAECEANNGWPVHGKWSVVGKNNVYVVWKNGNGTIDTITFTNPREYHWTDDHGSPPGVAAKMEDGLAELTEDGIAKALAGKWFARGWDNGWTATFAYAADGTVETFDKSGRQVDSGKWTVAGNKTVRVTWSGAGDTQTIEFKNPREFRWKEDQGNGGGDATKLDEDLSEDNTAKALVGKWHGKAGGHGWEGIYVYAVDGSYEVFSLSGKKYTTGSWAVTGKNKVNATWPGGVDDIEFINSREYRWTNLDGWDGDATKME